MLRPSLVFAFFCVISYFFTMRSLEFPVFHFLLTPYWAFAFFYWWDEKRMHLLAAGVFVFTAWQFYYGYRTGFHYFFILWLMCAAVFFLLMLVRKIFESRIGTRISQVAEKSRELEANRKKYDSRQQSLDHLERQVASLLNLFEIARELSEAINFSGLAENLSKTLKNELQFETVIIWIPSKSKDSAENLFKIIEISHEGTFSLLESQSLDLVFLNQIESGRQMIRKESTWYFPAFDQNNLYAVFGIKGADEKDLAKIEVLSSFLALLVKKISLYETIRELSILDDLTQVFVRRHFMERLNEEIKRSQRFKTPLSLLMLDIDHFKRYNDEFGHLVGDATLKKVSEILKLNVRRVDLVGRYGGEEFIVVMPETKQAAALEVAERIRSYIARHTFKLYHVEAKVTVSQGIATYDPSQSHLPETSDIAPVVERLIQAADKCLYQAKEDGRNRVMVYKDWV